VRRCRYLNKEHRGTKVYYDFRFFYIRVTSYDFKGFLRYPHALDTLKGLYRFYSRPIYGFYGLYSSLYLHCMDIYGFQKV